jgi:hypothetical protein
MRSVVLYCDGARTREPNRSGRRGCSPLRRAGEGARGAQEESQQRHDNRSFSTTEGYIREAENVREGFGEAFAPLPAALAEVSAFGVVRPAE